MPLRWEIFHPQKLVHIVAEGAVTREELEEHFDAIVVADAMPYAKLFDATLAEPAYNDDDVMLMGARLSAYTATLEAGPLAVVGLGDAVETAFRRRQCVAVNGRPRCSRRRPRRAPGSRH